MVGGLICENGGQLIKDKVAVLGAEHQGEAAPAGRLHDPVRRSPTPARRAEGLYLSVAGVPADQLTGAGATFVSDFQAKYNPDFIDPYTPYAAAAAQVCPERDRGL